MIESVNLCVINMDNDYIFMKDRFRSINEYNRLDSSNDCCLYMKLLIDALSVIF